MNSSTLLRWSYMEMKLTRHNRSHSATTTWLLEDDHKHAILARRLAVRNHILNNYFVTMDYMKKFMRLFRGIFGMLKSNQTTPPPLPDVSKRCSQQALFLVDNINKTLMPPKSPIPATWSTQTHPPLLQSKPGKQHHHGTKMPRDWHASFTLSVSSPFSSHSSASTCFSERHFMADTAGISNSDRCDYSHRISSGR